MSQENVELVRQLQPGPDMDLAHVVRDERLVTAWIEAGDTFQRLQVPALIALIGSAWRP